MKKIIILTIITILSCSQMHQKEKAEIIELIEKDQQLMTYLLENCLVNNNDEAFMSAIEDITVNNNANYRRMVKSIENYRPITGLISERQRMHNCLEIKDNIISFLTAMDYIRKDSNECSAALKNLLETDKSIKEKIKKLYNP